MLFNASRQASPPPLSPDSPEQAQAESTCSSSSPSLPPSPDRTEHVYTDKLQLRIPLLNNVNTVRKSTETLETSTEETHAVGVVESTETLETLVEETLTVDVIQASLNEEIPPEMIDKIINELRDEPDLQDIFSSIEEQIQFEQLGMDLEMLEDDLLEKELLYW